MSYTRQEAFTRAYLGLRAQGFKRAMATGSTPCWGVAWGCVLRDDVGRRCAVGHLLDGLPLNQGGTPESRALCLTDVRFYNALRNAHDNGYSPTGMQASLHAMAAEFNLEVPQ